MTAAATQYRLAGAEPAIAIPHEAWYQCPIPRKELKALMRRSDWPALGNYALWLGATAAFGAAAALSWGDPWLAVPLFAVYGVLYASGGESRWHECSHGTSFRTRWINEAFYHLASFLALKNPYAWRWSHTRHHTDTIVVGRDPEIAFPRPPDVRGMVLNLLYLKTGLTEVRRMLRHAAGGLSPDEREYVPESERRKVYWTGRAHVLILAGTAAASVVWETLLPLMLIGLPTFYGSWLHHVTAATQHAGLAENVPDHRLNTRTVYLNPVLRFVYSNMNYHIEHHMFPMVPFHALPALHEAVKHDMPRPYRGLVETYRELIPALLKQVRDPSYFVERSLPPGARPSPAPAETGAFR